MDETVPAPRTAYFYQCPITGRLIPVPEVTLVGEPTNDGVKITATAHYPKFSK